MAYLMIGVLQQNKKVIGYRIFDTESKKQFMDVPADNVKQIIQTGKAEISNLEIQDGELAGANGSIERYPKLASNGVLISQTSPLVILNQLGNVGYTVVDYAGKVKKARTNDVVEYAKKFGIANGKVVMKDNVEFISSITGTYPVEKIAASKVHNDDAVKIHIAVTNRNQPTNSVERHTDVDVEIEIEESDVFSAMDESQKTVIKAYYVWYTVDKYMSLAKSIRLNLNVGKAERLSELRGITEWEFAGIEDCGFMGGSKCELGHNLRYAYYAVPADDRDNEDARIIFGETCSADFFNIDPEDMKKLVKTRTIMSDEIKLMADILANGQERLYIGKAELLYAVLRKLATKEKITALFGNKVGLTLLSFIMVKLPFPMSLVLEASKQVSQNIKGFYNLVFPEYASAIQEILSGNNTSYFMAGGKEYLSFIATNKIEGAYAYNPLNDDIKRRDVGAYNKQTRYERDKLLNKISMNALCRDFNMDEIDALLYCADSLINHKKDILEKFKGTPYAEISNEKLAIEAKKLAEDREIDNELRTGLIAIYNSALVAIGYNIYRYRVMYYDTNHNMLSYQRYIKSLRNDLKSAKGQPFNAALEKIYGTTIKADLDKEKARKEEEAMIERERLEKEKQRREQEEADRIKREQEEADRIKREQEAERLKKQQEEENKKKESTAEEDKAAKLKDLMEKHPKIQMDRGMEVAKAILGKDKPYGELSPKQKWRIEDTIKKYQSLIAGNSVKDNTAQTNATQVKTEDVNNSYQLSEHPEINTKVQRVISSADSVEMQEVLKQLPNVIKIAYTIARNGRASDKQLKHINKATEILDQA